MIHIGQRTREERKQAPAAAGSMDGIGNEMCPADPDADGSAFVQVDRGQRQCKMQGPDDLNDAFAGGEFEKCALKFYFWIRFRFSNSN